MSDGHDALGRPVLTTSGHPLFHDLDRETVLRETRGSTDPVVQVLREMLAHAHELLESHKDDAETIAELRESADSWKAESESIEEELERNEARFKRQEDAAKAFEHLCLHGFVPRYGNLAPMTTDQRDVVERARRALVDGD
jgi:hypothetical protein